MSRAARLAYRAAAQANDPDRLIWDRDGCDWPNRFASHFVRAGGLNWHVQTMGQGPVMLLVHGTGASTHSWAAIAPLLARHFTIVAPDLPGHGFTDLPPPAGLSLPAMAGALGDLLRTLGLSPEIAVGHSAGAAILARMSLDGRIAPEIVISLNGAFLPMRGLPIQLLSGVTRILVGVPAFARLVARRAADPAAVRRLLDGTGSRLRPDQVELYRRLFGTTAHVAGALGMMANWRLDGLARELGRLKPALLLVTAENDRTIPPADAARVRKLAPAARIISVPGFGHLAHEEAPDLLAGLIARMVAAPDKEVQS